MTFPTNGFAIYPGSFDPFTTGHLGILKQAAPLFQHIKLAVAVNPLKSNPMFPVESRLAFLRDIANEYIAKDQHMSVGSYPITGPEGLYTVDYAESIGATHIIRGLRNNTDFEQEFAMAEINKGINPRIQTVFFMADANLSPISSSMVRGLIGPKGWRDVIKEYIPMPMWDRFIKLVDTSK